MSLRGTKQSQWLGLLSPSDTLRERRQEFRSWILLEIGVIQKTQPIHVLYA